MARKLKETVAIAGVGCTRFGDLLTTEELQGLSIQELGTLAAREAIEDAGIDTDQIDLVIVGQLMTQSSQLPSTYSQLASWIGQEYTSAVHMETACSTTNVGATLAVQAIASGAHDNVLVLGLETTRTKPKGHSPYEREAIPSDEMWLWTDMSVDQAYAVPQGYDIFSTYNGILGQAYMRKYGVSAADYDRYMYEIALTRRFHGSKTPKAFIQETIEDEAKRLGFNDPFEFWQSRYNPFASWPARLRSLVTPADGASAMVLTRGEIARGLKKAPVTVAGFGVSVKNNPWYGEDPTIWEMDRLAIDRAYQMSGIGPEDIQYLHTHDCSHISGVLTAELTGYFRPGEGLKQMASGETRFDGKRPMTTHGGRHAFGHAWAASAGSDTYEAVKQMRGEADGRQIPKPPEVSVIHTHGYSMIGTVLVLTAEG